MTHLSTIKSLAIAGILSFGVAPVAIAQAETRAETIITQADIVPQADIATIVSGAPEFSTLKAAVETAGLVGALMGEGPLTVVAPTNDAFAALPAGVLDALLQPENQDLLTNILAYHVIPDEVMYDDFSTGAVDTLGEALPVTADNDMVLVDEVPIVAFDLPATNGIIHIIEQVLVPDSVLNELTARLTAAEETMAEETMAEETMVEETMVEEETMMEEAAPATPEPIQGLW